jgi:hypothetical protein
VNGGIVSGLSHNSFLVINGNDLMTKIVRKWSLMFDLNQIYDSYWKTWLLIY